jgi:hypothetical protein
MKLQVFRKKGHWGISWICDAGHRTNRLIDPEQEDARGTHVFRCCRCKRSIDVPMRLLAV